MEPRAGLQSLIEDLAAAQDLLQRTAHAHPAVYAATRTLQRIARVLNRPFRIAVLGESNSGKSTIANFIAGEMALPALPVANTRLPTLLHYAPVPFVEALHETGRRSALAPDDELPLEDILRLEVGLPSEALRGIEILDFPGSANPLFHACVSTALRHRIDAAIWATVATQAWRETERQAWLKLPQRIKSRGILAVTHRDLIRSGDDFAKLKARLQAVQQEHFGALCFVAAEATHAVAGSPHPAAGLLLEVRRLVQDFDLRRAGKAVLVTRKIASRALATIDPGA